MTCPDAGSEGGSPRRGRDPLAGAVGRGRSRSRRRTRSAQGLARRARPRVQPRGEGLRAGGPTGVLLLGVPGCGKSLVAKSFALRRALLSIESMAPVVVWVDEIEKGFATSVSAGDGGVGQRVLGGFLRWLQERHGQVFLVATCNDVESLPPELLRRGRFDEVFFVDLPGPVGRDPAAASRAPSPRSCLVRSRRAGQPNQRLLRGRAGGGRRRSPVSGLRRWERAGRRIHPG